MVFRLTSELSTNHRVSTRISLLRILWKFSSWKGSPKSWNEMFSFWRKNKSKKLSVLMSYYSKYDNASFIKLLLKSSLPLSLKMLIVLNNHSDFRGITRIFRGSWMLIRIAEWYKVRGKWEKGRSLEKILKFL